ncbi:MAG: hypothetical protein JRH20_19110 [Deltaproteobacteria bacterium]|nr:hypothetical protein [Deltaproteobacteria bacterium]
MVYGIVIGHPRMTLKVHTQIWASSALALFTLLGCREPTPPPQHPPSVTAQQPQRENPRTQVPASRPASRPAAASQPAAQPVEPSSGVASALTLPKPDSLQRFFRRLEELKQKKRKRVRITVWGASHIAGEAFTGQLRRRFQAEFGDGGPGFVIPGRPWRSYRHSSVSFGEQGRWRSERIWTRYTRRHREPRDDLFGLGGISVHTRWCASAWFKPRKRRPVAAFDLYYLKQPKGGRIDIEVGDKRLGRVSTAARRKQPGFAHIELPVGASRVTLQARGGEVRFYGVDLQSGKPGVVVDALGINGGRADRILEWNNKVMAAQVARLAPDLIVLAYGSNSISNEQLTPALLAKALHAVLGRMRRLAPDADCLFIGPADQARKDEEKGWQVPANLGWIIATQRQVAHARGCGYWDWQEAMGGASSVFAAVGADPPRVRKDHVHFTWRGYTLYANALHAALMALRK